MQHIYTEQPVLTAAEHLARTIQDHLAVGERVLWLLSGGSGAKVVLETARLLSGTDLTNLAVTLSDERYGPVGHADENWQQLIDSHLDLPGATLYRPLRGEDRQTTTNDFAAWLTDQMTRTQYAIGLFGIGSDGHTAGIKPHSPAVTAPSLAADFNGDDFERITITPRLIAELDEVVIQASGADKASVLKALLHETIAIDQQPAQILKSVPKCTLYTDTMEL